MARRPQPPDGGLQLAEIRNLPDLDAATIGIAIEMGHFNNYRKVRTGAVISEQSSRVESDETATRDLRYFKVNKRLVDCPELRRVELTQAHALDHVYRVSLPSYLRAGVHRLPVGLVVETDGRLVEYRTELAAHVEALVGVWPTRIREMARRLGDQWDAEDYPTTAELANLFYIRWRYVSLGNPDQLQALAPELFETQRRIVEDAAQQQAQEIRLQMRQEGLAMMTRFRDRMLAVSAATGAPAQVRGSLLEDLQAFLRYEPHRNVTGDRDLSAIMTGVRADIAGVTIDQIRDNESLRRNLGEAAAMAASALESLVQPATRAIRVRGAA